MYTYDIDSVCSRVRGMSTLCLRVHMCHMNIMCPYKQIGNSIIDGSIWKRLSQGAEVGPPESTWQSRRPFPVGSTGLGISGTESFGDGDRVRVFSR